MVSLYAALGKRPCNVNATTLVLSLSTMERILRIETPIEYGIFDARLSPNGLFLACLGAAPEVYIYELSEDMTSTVHVVECRTQAERRRNADFDNLQCVWDRSGRYLAVSSDFLNHMKVWNMETSQLTHKVDTGSW